VGSSQPKYPTFSGFTYKNKKGFEDDSLSVKSDSQPEEGCQTSHDTQHLASDPSQMASSRRSTFRLPRCSPAGEAGGTRTLPAARWVQPSCHQAPQTPTLHTVPDRECRRKRHNQHWLHSSRLALNGSAFLFSRRNETSTPLSTTRD